MSRTPKHETISGWKLERFLLDELDPAEMDSIRRALAVDAELRARLDALRRSDEEILRSYPPQWMVRRIHEKMGPGAHARGTSAAERRSWSPLRALGPAALAAAVLIAILVGLPQPAGEQDIRLKGEVEQLRVYRRTTGGSEQLHSGDRVAEHDVVLLQVLAQQPRFAAVLSVDGRGAITQHLPEQGNRAVALQPGKARFLEHGYALDDAPRWEIFVLVTAPHEFSLETVTRALEYASPATEPELPDEYRVITFTLVKEAAP